MSGLSNAQRKSENSSILETQLSDLEDQNRKNE